MLTEFRPICETPNLVHGVRFERESVDVPWREVMGPGNGGAAIPKNTLWFEGTAQEILTRIGVTCSDPKRAHDLANLFDGNISGFYYVAEASPPGSEEAIIWILGGLAAHVNVLNQDRAKEGLPKLGWTDFPRILPADYLHAFCEFKEANKFPPNFAKDIFAELLKRDRFMPSSHSPEGCVVMFDDYGGGKDVSDMTWEEYEAAIDEGCVVKNYAPDRWSHTERLNGQWHMTRLVKDQRFQAVDDTEIDLIIAKVMADNPKEVEKARANPRAVQWFIGQVIKASKGKASPQVVQVKLKEQFPS